jgi:hypothetical protein
MRPTFSVRVEGRRVTAVEAQRLWRSRCRLKLQIFDPATAFLRLRDGKICPCVQCGYPYRENLFELICGNCRGVNAASLENPVVVSVDCQRCGRATSGFDLCDGCLDAIERRKVQLFLDFDPEPAKPPRPFTASGRESEP